MQKETQHDILYQMSICFRLPQASFEVILAFVVVDLRLVNEFLDVVDHDGVLDVVRVKHSQQVLTWMGFSKFFL